jgi:ferredoxin
MKVNLDKCLHCGGCVGSCPTNAIYLNDFVLEFNSSCNKCMRCVKICPVHALSLEGKK